MINKSGRTILVVVSIILFGILLSYISINELKPEDHSDYFPIGVDPSSKTIIENEQVYVYFPVNDSGLEALALRSLGNIFSKIRQFSEPISIFINNESLALVSGEKIVRITPGLRREEVADKFAKALGWKAEEKKSFLADEDVATSSLEEGMFVEGIYFVSKGTKQIDVKDMILKRFHSEVLSRYSTSTAEVVPIGMALTVASLIQRETIGTDDMRLVSGIIWNRIFANMKLQLDATLQYAKANANKNMKWWPQVNPKDKFIKSPYNTYLHTGLPPSPIASPSVSAIVAALNPAQTDCMFYFHDKKGNFNCSPTYEEHVVSLKKIYGQGR